MLVIVDSDFCVSDARKTHAGVPLDMVSMVLIERAK